MNKSIYFNHNTLEKENDFNHTLINLKELVQLNSIILDYSYKLFFYNRIYDTNLCGKKFLLFLHNDLKNVQNESLYKALCEFINNGPHFPKHDSSFSINNDNYLDDLLNICLQDNQNVILTLINEKIIIQNDYKLNDFSINNLIGEEALIEYLKEKSYTEFKTIDEVFLKIESNYGDEIIITEKAKRTAKKHTFISLDYLYKALEEAVKIILCLSLDNPENKDISEEYYQVTKFEISPESKKTLQQYGEERECIINGKKILFSNHIKIDCGTGNDRIYYIIIDNKLYIGHCGMHLRTDTRNK